MHSLRYLALLVLPLIAVACSDSPTATTTTQLGEATIESIENNTGYLWYQSGYDAYPTVERQAEFDQAVQTINASFDPAAHSVIMVIKPNCSCQNTQRELPRVMKTLDEAGFPRENITIYITDSRLAGIDDVIAQYNIDEAPTFIVLKNDVEMGRIELMPPVDTSVEDELATFFSVP